MIKLNYKEKIAEILASSNSYFVSAAKALPVFITAMPLISIAADIMAALALFKNLLCIVNPSDNKYSLIIDLFSMKIKSLPQIFQKPPKLLYICTNTKYCFCVKNTVKNISL